MIPDHLIEVAMDAYAEASGQSVSRPWMEAVFNTIAAHIWDEGYEAGAGDEFAINRAEERGTEWPPLTPNPYRASEGQ